MPGILAVEIPSQEAFGLLSRTDLEFLTWCAPRETWPDLLVDNITFTPLTTRYMVLARTSKCDHDRRHCTPTSARVTM